MQHEPQDDGGAQKTDRDCERTEACKDDNVYEAIKTSIKWEPAREERGQLGV